MIIKTGVTIQGSADNHWSENSKDRIYDVNLQWRKTRIPDSIWGDKHECKLQILKQHSGSTPEKIK